MTVNPLLFYKSAVIFPYFNFVVAAKIDCFFCLIYILSFNLCDGNLMNGDNPKFSWDDWGVWFEKYYEYAIWTSYDWYYILHSQMMVEIRWQKQMNYLKNNMKRVEFLYFDSIVCCAVQLNYEHEHKSMKNVHRGAESTQIRFSCLDIAQKHIQVFFITLYFSRARTRDLFADVDLSTVVRQVIGCGWS